MIQSSRSDFTRLPWRIFFALTLAASAFAAAPASRGSLLPAVPATGTISLQLYPASAPNASDVEVRILIAGNSAAIESFGLRLGFDTAKFTYQSIQKGTLTSAWSSVDANQATPGTLIVGGYPGGGASIPASSSGSLAIVTLRAACPSCAVGQTSAIAASTYVDDIAQFTPAPVSATFTFGAPPSLAVSKTRLNFGHELGVVTTSSQTFLITNGESGVMTWTISGLPAWLSCDPMAGIGNSAVQATANPAGLTQGSYSGSITIASPEASNSPATVNVFLTIHGPTLSTFPFGSFDSPLDGADGVTGAIPVTGWALDDVEVTKVEIWRDPVLEAGEVNDRYSVGNAIFIEGARPDVETGYPEYPLNYRGGWGYMLLTNFLPNHGNGTYVLYAVASDADGHTVELGAKTITCDNANALKPFGTIDTPAQGGTASGAQFVNFGWVLTPLPGTVTKDGSTITVYVDSVLRGNLSTPPNLYNAYRPDVSGNFPGLNNTGGPLPGQGGPVGAFFLNTTAFANGIHSIFWIAFDDMGRGEGIGSRFFSIVNLGGSPAPAGEAAGSVDPAPQRVPHSLDMLRTIPRAFAPLSARRGFDRDAPVEVSQPDNTGAFRFEIEEVELLQVDLGFVNEPDAPAAAGSGPAFYGGFEVVKGELRSLPIGSTLDPGTGRFSWLPGPGFLGSYKLVFVETGAGTRRSFPIEIVVKTKR